MEFKPTYSGCIRTCGDAIRIIIKVHNKELRIITKRLKTDSELASIQSGSIFVHIQGKEGIHRWTDGMKWSDSRILGKFFIYRQISENGSYTQNGLIKLTFSFNLYTKVYHLIAYYIADGFKNMLLNTGDTESEKIYNTLHSLPINESLLDVDGFRNYNVDKILTESCRLPNNEQLENENVGYKRPIKRNQNYFIQANGLNQYPLGDYFESVDLHPAEFNNRKNTNSLKTSNIKISGQSYFSGNYRPVKRKINGFRTSNTFQDVFVESRPIQNQIHPHQQQQEDQTRLISNQRSSNSSEINGQSKKLVTGDGMIEESSFLLVIRRKFRKKKVLKAEKLINFTNAKFIKRNRENANEVIFSEVRSSLQSSPSEIPSIFNNALLEDSAPVNNTASEIYDDKAFSEFLVFYPEEDTILNPETTLNLFDTVEEHN